MSEEVAVNTTLNISRMVVCRINPAYDRKINPNPQYTTVTRIDCLMATPASNPLRSKLNLSKYANMNMRNTLTPSKVKTIHRGRECLLKKYRAFDRDISIHFGLGTFILNSLDTQMAFLNQLSKLNFMIIYKIFTESSIFCLFNLTNSN